MSRLQSVQLKLWLWASNGIGYLENGKLCIPDDLPMNNNIVSIMTDYLGDLWFTSSRQGVMKVVPNRFNDFSMQNGLSETVVKTIEEVFKRSDKAMYEDKIAMKAQRTD